MHTPLCSPPQTDTDPSHDCFEPRSTNLLHPGYRCLLHALTVKLTVKRGPQHRGSVRGGSPPPVPPCYNCAVTITAACCQKGSHRCLLIALLAVRGELGTLSLYEALPMASVSSASTARSVPT